MFNTKAESSVYKLMTDADVSYSTTEHDTGATSDKTVGLRINSTTVTITGTDTYAAKSGRNLYVTIYYTKTV